MSKVQTNRKIHVHGEISTESYDKFAKRMSRLERDGSGVIELELFSEGGLACAALAYSARIRRSPCAVRITAYGLVASAAVLILAAGDDRHMAKDAWLMVHEDSISEFEGDATAVRRLTKQLDLMENQWSQLLAELTNASKEEWMRLHSIEQYISAEECLRLGIADVLF